MSRLILAHAPGDEAIAERLRSAAHGVATIVLCIGPQTRAPTLGPGVLLGLVWTHQAASSASGALLANVATGVRGAFLIHADDALPNEPLAALRLIATPAHAGAEDLAAAMRSARLIAAHRSASTPRPTTVALAAAQVHAANPRPTYGRLFLSGLTRGLASSLAVMSVAGGVTIGIQESAGLVGGLEASAAEPQAPTSLRVAVRASAGLVSDDEMRAEATSLRAYARAERPHVGEMLTIADHDLADARERTSRILARLKELADSPTLGASPMHAAAPPAILDADLRGTMDQTSDVAAAPSADPRA